MKSLKVQTEEKLSEFHLIF